MWDTKDVDEDKILLTSQLKQSPVLGSSIPVLGVKPKRGVVRILVIFQDRPMFSRTIQNVSARAFH